MDKTGKFTLPISYEDAKKILSERFNLNILDQIFQSWRNSVTMETIRATAGRIARVYEHDHHLYKSDMYVDEYIVAVSNTLCENFCVKLPNNGFLYSRDTDLKVLKAGLQRHHSETWSLLEKEYINHFPHIAEFCREFFGSSDIKFKMYYNFLEDRFDFKAFAATDFTRGLVITFEPFPTCDEDFDTDYWSSLP